MFDQITMQFRAAVIQTRTTPDTQASVETALQMVKDAARSGAALVTLPETISYLGPEGAKKALAEPIDGPTFRAFGDLAKDLNIHLLAGSLPEKSPDPERPYNTSVLFGPHGQLLAAYRKIHLFDIDLQPDGPKLMESQKTHPGHGLVVAETPLGKIGLSICYDIRFPELFSELVRRGAELIVVPAAFTVPTGSDHWEVLLRARAIETQCFVLAPAQWGQHWEKRRSYGRSMIVDPWGTVLSTCPDKPSIAYAEIDLERLKEIRKRMPCSTHRRLRDPSALSSTAHIRDS